MPHRRGKTMRKQHDYPTSRKNRDCSYSKSYKLLQAVGEQKLRELFALNGMYIVAKQVSEMLGQEITPAVVNYTRGRYNLGKIACPLG